MGAQLNTMRGQIALNPSSVSFPDLTKRLFDVVLASIGLIILMPLFVIVSMFLRRDSPGPVFYRGARTGKNGRPFEILKFRTMHENAASYGGPRLTSSGDQRITPLGHWLRNTKINELPQLWNVLVGDMSLVGPRPEDPEFVGHYPEEVRNEVLSIRPGITSPASVLYHAEQDMLANTDLMGTYLEEILPDKLHLDQLYVRNRSFVSDIDIIFWTLAIFIPRISRTNIPEGYLFAGPLSRFIYRHFSWLMVDMAVVFTVTSMVSLAWRTQGSLGWGWDAFLLLSIGFALFSSAVNYAIGLNRIYWSKATGEDAIGLFFSSGGVTATALILNYLQIRHHWFSFPALPPVMIVSIGILAHFGFICVRYRFRLLTWLAESWSALKKDVPGTGERILILGEGESCQIASWLLRRGMFRHAFSVVGIVANEDATKEGMLLNGCRVVGGVRDLPALVQEYDVRMIVYALSGAAPNIRDMVFSISKSSHVKLVFMDDLMRFISMSPDKPAEVQEYLEWIQKRADFLPLRDTLTGLASYTLFEERLRHSIAYSERYNTNPALLIIDLNGSIDRERGDSQKIEDDLLKLVAKRLVRFKRASDTLARFRAHEFALLLENVPDKRAAQMLQERTKALLVEPIAVGANVVFMQPKISLFYPAVNMEDLQSRLDTRVDDQKHAKAVGPKALGSMVLAHRAQRAWDRRSEKH